MITLIELLEIDVRNAENGMANHRDNKANYSTYWGMREQALHTISYLKTVKAKPEIGLTKAQIRLVHTVLKMVNERYDLSDSISFQAALDIMNKADTE